MGSGLAEAVCSEAAIKEMLLIGMQQFLSNDGAEMISKGGTLTVHAFPQQAVEHYLKTYTGYGMADMRNNTLIYYAPEQVHFCIDGIFRSTRIFVSDGCIAGDGRYIIRIGRSREEALPPSEELILERTGAAWRFCSYRQIPADVPAAD